MQTPDNLEAIESRAAELAILELGYQDLFDPLRVRAAIRRVAGGYLIFDGDVDSFDELHVFTHGGLHLPRRLARLMVGFDIEEMAQSIHRNRDSSTSALAMEMIDGLGNPRSPRRLIAFFDVARVVIDGNRIHVNDQMPTRPYSGISAFSQGLEQEKKIQIVEGLWRPWFDAVDSEIAKHNIQSVFHHHTYDPIGTGLAAHELGPAQNQRPAGMVCRRAPSSMSELGIRTLLHPELLRRVVGTLQTHFGRLDDKAQVMVDWPYRAPEMPFLPRVRLESTNSSFQTIIYEARKDLLAGDQGLERFTLAVEDLSAQTAEHCGYG